MKHCCCSCCSCLLLLTARFTQRQENVGECTTAPLMSLSVCHSSVCDDAIGLIIHHVKRQSSIHSDEKRKIKRLLRQFLPTLYALPATELSDDEDDDDDDDDDKGILLF